MELTQSLLFVVSMRQIPLRQEQHQTEPELEIQMQMFVLSHQKLMGQEPVHQMELMVPQTIQY